MSWKPLCLLFDTQAPHVSILAARELLKGTLFHNGLAIIVADKGDDMVRRREVSSGVGTEHRRARKLLKKPVWAEDVAEYMLLCLRVETAQHVIEDGHLWARI